MRSLGLGGGLIGFPLPDLAFLVRSGGQLVFSLLPSPTPLGLLRNGQERTLALLTLNQRTVRPAQSQTVRTSLSGRFSTAHGQASSAPALVVSSGAGSEGKSAVEHEKE